MENRSYYEREYLEFSSPGSFEPITDIVGGGPYNLKPGQWTDDTSMALCLADSLLTCRGFDPIDQTNRYLRWRDEGYLSSTGRCFDIGNTINEALSTFDRERQPYCGLTSRNSAGNGSIMRLAPVPMFYRSRPNEAIDRCAESSRITHSTRMAVDACRYFGGLLISALNGKNKEEILSGMHHPVNGSWKRDELAPEIEVVATGSFKQKEPPAIRGTGFVVDSLEAALWAFHKSRDFKHGCLLAVNLGDDADTTGAVYGQLAGAFYGVDSIPESWLEKLALKETIIDFADRLLTASLP